MQRNIQASALAAGPDRESDLVALTGDAVGRILSIVTQPRNSLVGDAFRIAEGACLACWSLARWQTASSEAPGLGFRWSFGTSFEALKGLQAWLEHLHPSYLWAAATLGFCMVAIGILPRAAALASAVIVAGRIESAAPGADFELVIMGFLAFWLFVLPVGSGFALVLRATQKSPGVEVPGTAPRLCLASLVVLYANARFWSGSVAAAAGTAQSYLLWLVPTLIVLRFLPTANRLLLIVQPMFHLVFWLQHGGLFPHLALAATTLLSCRGPARVHLLHKGGAATESFTQMSSPFAAGCTALFFVALTAQLLDATPIAAVSLQWVRDLACPTGWLIIR